MVFLEAARGSLPLRIIFWNALLICIFKLYHFGFWNANFSCICLAYLCQQAALCALYSVGNVLFNLQTSSTISLIPPYLHVLYMSSNIHKMNVSLT